MAYEPHALAEIFPLLEGAPFDELVADIKANGLADAIDLYQGKILDGRNRYRALLAADIETAPRHFRHFRPEFYGEPLAYVISKNLRRRHLNDDQRRMVAARLSSMPRGQPSVNAAECGITRKAAAAMLAVDQPGVERARTVIAKAAPEVRLAVDRGQLTVAAAAQAVKLAPDIQRRIAEEAGAGRTAVVRSVLKQERRASHERILGEMILSLPQKKYGVILADPEWRFEPRSRETGLDRAPDNHYATSPTDVIATRDVASIAARDCALFLWATAPMLPQAMLVMKAWGFEYKTHTVWVKERVGNQKGLGYWFWGEHELLLLGTCGQVPAPAPGQQWISVCHAPVAGHSAKPEVFFKMIEEYFPTLPKIELNRRGLPRPGWDAWGAEAKQEATNETAKGGVAAGISDQHLGRLHAVDRAAGAVPAVDGRAHSVGR